MRLHEISAFLGCLGCSVALSAQVLSLEQPSTNAGGQAANSETFSTNSSHGRALSRNGRWFVFRSAATNLIPGVSGTQVYLYDRQFRIFELISVGSQGAGDSSSLNPAVSGDGRYVVFYSEASNLVANDSNGVGDIFVRDRLDQQTRRVSLTAQGAQLTAASNFAAISGDGRTVAFATPGSPPNSTLEYLQVYVMDLATGLPELVSRTPSGGAGAGNSRDPALSADGRKVVFESNAELFGAAPTFQDTIYLYDRDSGQMEKINVPAAGGIAGPGNSPSISDDGQRVAFSTSARLDLMDNNLVTDAYVRDRRSGSTMLASLASDGNAINVGAFYPVISADGAWLIYASSGANVVPGGIFGSSQLYVRNLDSGAVALVSTDRNGNATNGGVIFPVVGGNASVVGFPSTASNLMPDVGASTELATVYLSVPAVDEILRDGF